MAEKRCVGHGNFKLKLPDGTIVCQRCLKSLSDQNKKK